MADDTVRVVFGLSPELRVLAMVDVFFPQTAPNVVE